MKPVEELRELWEAEWSGENLSDSALAEKFIEWAEGFETKLREFWAKEIMIQIEAPTNISSDWYAATKRTKMAAASIVGNPNDPR